MNPISDNLHDLRNESVSENRTAFIAALIMDKCRDKHGDSLNAFQASHYAAQLCSIASRIHRLAEIDCNHGLTDAQEHNMDKARREFEKLADALGFDAKTGGDPRGCCAYLVNPNNHRDGDSMGGGWGCYV